MLTRFDEKETFIQLCGYQVVCQSNGKTGEAFGVGSVKLALVPSEWIQGCTSLSERLTRFLRVHLICVDSFTGRLLKSPVSRVLASS